MGDKFLGYRRENGSGRGAQPDRHHSLGFLLRQGSATHLRERSGHGAFLVIRSGCSQVGEDLEITAKTLIGIGRNPNFAGVVVVGLGCERFYAARVVRGHRAHRQDAGDGGDSGRRRFHQGHRHRARAMPARCSRPPRSSGGRRSTSAS